ncbi:uncharacterized protein LOC111862989 isoform X2 [Cryptotermes secundus]|uniref:uncharacterized protein LOC111862989 isoform X2 n=1 Tax=Cryptotermes secundus TaxID=105785 RepID=UPI000CD7CA42|nr:uncharacterized protein LOC111862989 isoform X2 [Cryptotermes secundus]
MVEINSSHLLDYNDTIGSSTLYNLSNDNSACNCSTITPVLTTSGGHYRVHHGPVLLLTPSAEAVKAQLKWGFLLHTYGFACLFFILAFYAFFSILNLRSLISSRPFMSTINGFLCLLGVSRAGCLFIDPYNLREAMPRVLGSVLWDVGMPCITSAFCLIQLAFLQLTQSCQHGRRKLCDLSHGATIYIVSPWSRVGKYMLNLGPEKLRRKSCLSLIITAHFSFLIGADIAVGFQEQLMLVKYVVQLAFLCWGIFLCCTFLYGGYRVMGLLCRMPGGLLHRDPPGHQRKGIMQLALLAPYNNLASSVAAALVPTLLTPKIRITDENDHTFSFGSDSNSQPMDISQQQDTECCSSNPQPSSRGSVRPGSPDPRRRILPSVQVHPPTPTPTIVVSPGSRRSSLASRRGSEFESLAGSRRGSEASRRSSEISRRGSEASRRGSEVSRRGSEVEPGPGTAHSLETIGRRAVGELGSRRGSECSCSNLSQQLGTELARRGSSCSRRGSECSCSNLSQQLGTELARRGSSCSRIGSECSSLGDIAEDEIRIVQQEELPVLPASPSVGGAGSKSRKKSLSWQQQATASGSKEQHHNLRQQVVSCSEQSEDEVTAETSLLPHQEEHPAEEKAGDLTLHSILNHIAYVNRAALPIQPNMVTSPPTSRKSQVQKVLNATYITALLGLVLCVADMGRLCGPYGLMAPTSNSTGRTPRGGDSLDPLQQNDATGLRPWPWFCFQTLCRALEFAMGCAMANITKQPVNSRHQSLQQQYAYSLRLKQHRESLYM